ncbi:CRAL-TRIO domain-containing protein [Vararia minispora EC-137]|uniref:CRAL-TRIO domain-containing protein n=1 Tax=Vararia minispora EC-137 TaxID=1314806 RepID=A0ACB8QSG9_9AGAM|nr:CRAL-TRIO domain-containing protein [Vararia minispora EC-137]
MALHCSRFLRARSYNVKDALKMLQECLEWRRTVQGVGMTELYKRLDPFDYPNREHVFRHWPMYFHKTDKHGRPVNIQSFGQVDLPELYKHVSPDQHWETVIVNAEALISEVLPACSSSAGRSIEHSLIIIDLKGFSLSQFWQMKSLVSRSLHASQSYYPETMGKLVIINAPRSFTTIWSFVKQLMNERTVKKVEVLGDKYSDLLLSLIPEENLPATLGGKCNCQGGCSLSNAGLWMDGRKERREQWLRGERRHPGVEWAEPELDEASRSTIYDIGTVKLDEEELLALNGGGTSPQPQTSAVAVSA